MAQEFTSSPSSLPPLLTPSLSSRTPHPPFYVPGPSSRFNSTEHERSRSQKTFQRDDTPTAPSLSTAQRAHRRVQSTANAPTLRRMLPSTPQPAPTQARSEKSPMNRFDTRFYTYTPNRMASTESVHSPVTPAAKQIHSTSTPRPKDSPFSDYFTDDGHSNGNNDSAFRAPSAETQQLLVRLNKLQAQLMRSSPEDVLSEHEKAVIVARKIGEIETQFHALNSQTRSQSRLPAELEDSGLFIDDDDDESMEEGETPDTQIEVESFERAAKAFLTSVGEGEDMTAKPDTLLRDAQKVLENVSRAYERTRQLYAEARANHEQCAAQIDGLEAENARLRSSTTTLEFENSALLSTSEKLQTAHESLKTDLSVHHAELLFLKLRHRGLEVEVETLNNGAHSLISYQPDLRAEIQRVKRAKIREGMSRWEEEWENIDQRMRGRRAMYGLPKEEESLQELLDLEDVDEDEEDVVETTEITTQISLLDNTDTVEIEDELDSIQEEIFGTIHLDKATQTEPIPTSPPDEQSKATQTSPLPSPATSSWVFANHDDCAITTSSEDNTASSGAGISTYAGDAEGEVEAPTTPVRIAAWRELWEGLQNLAGMGEGSL